MAITTTAEPAAIDGVAYSSALAASGGTAPYTWALASGAALPSGLSLSPTGAIAGSTSAQPATYPVAVTVTDSSTPAQTTSTTIELTVEANSENWAGLVDAGGPFTSVTGTFTIPSLFTGESASQAMGAWVGIDGYGDTSLIQAGIAEAPDPSNSNAFYLYPWWEILPNGPTVITTVTMSVGDSVTVTITQMSGTTWQISLVDDTNGQSFSTEQTYSGPAQSAEWIVEAPYDTTTNEVDALASFSPAVDFTNDSATGPVASNFLSAMVQNGQLVGSPSAVDANGFAVAYGSTPPPAP